MKRKVSECPHCGAPVYGKFHRKTDVVPDGIIYTCECRDAVGKGIWIRPSTYPTWPTKLTYPIYQEPYTFEPWIAWGTSNVSVED